MSGDERDHGPGVPTIMWVTLGLLAFNWLAVSGFSAWATLNGRLGQTEVLLNGAAWAYVAVPNLLLVVPTWANRTSGSTPEMLLGCCLFFAVLNTLIVVAVGVEVGVTGEGVGTFLGACIIWPVSWFVGLTMLLGVVLRAIEPTQQPRTPPADPPSVP